MENGRVGGTEEGRERRRKEGRGKMEDGRREERKEYKLAAEALVDYDRVSALFFCTRAAWASK